MYRVRLWSLRHSRGLFVCYKVVERGLSLLNGLFNNSPDARLEKAIFAIEKPIKKLLFDSQSCGQCTLGETGMSCPMNCPKTIRNGPCGGVRANGNCEVKPEMLCVWVGAWQGTQNLKKENQALQIVQPPVNWTFKNSSAWLRHARKRELHREGDIISVGSSN